MMRKNFWVALLIMGTMILGVPGAYAARPDSDPAQEKGFKDKRDAKIEELYKELNLTADQRTQLEENKAKNREQMKALFQAMGEKGDALREELQKETLNMEKITQLNNELKVLEGQMLDHRLGGILEVRKILSPEQFKQFMAQMDKKRDHFKNRGGDEKDGKKGRGKP
jgi:Spy/CpxP family protein refolding chaperone